MCHGAEQSDNKNVTIDQIAAGGRENIIYN